MTLGFGGLLKACRHPAAQPPGVTLAARCTSVSSAIRPSPPPLQRSLASFMTWGLVGFLGLGVLTSVRLFILPLLLIALIFAVRRYGVGAGTIGLIAGVGLACVGIGIINLGNRPCPSSPFVFGPGQLGSQECGGALGAPWLIGGIVCIVAAVALFILLERLPAQRA
jgi:hypothetical protein